MGSKLHAGFPEAALEKYATILVEKGYTVGIVEQVETPEQFNARKKGARITNQWEKC
jgi:DNA mismatch repair protein MSH6